MHDNRHRVKFSELGFRVKFSFALGIWEFSNTILPNNWCGALVSVLDASREVACSSPGSIIFFLFFFQKTISARVRCQESGAGRQRINSAEKQAKTKGQL